MTPRRFTVSAAGGRVSGLFPEPELNVFWVNPEPYSGRGWPNPGGDRTWISPESELFLPDRERGWASYCVPAAVDPGAYRMRELPDGAVELVNAGRITFFGLGSDAGFELQQHIAPWDGSGIVPPDGVSFAGYTKTVTLESTGPFQPGLQPAIWNLAQLPPGGELVVPGANPLPYFGAGRQHSGDGISTATVPSPGEPYKFGIAGNECSGRMFYCRWQVPKPYFVIRTFTPPSVCCDAPYQGGVACPQQLFCDDGSSGGFGELEYHSEPLPATGGRVVDTCRTGAFSGPVEQLQKLFRQLLQEGW